MLSTVEQARAYLDAIKYAPEGKRGCAFGIAPDDYDALPFTAALAAGNARTSLVALIEPSEGVENADAIAALDGVDCPWIGHSDLSIQLITLAEGEINELHVGLKGTMNALFLKDLAKKTHRGLEGRVRKGFSGGGNAFGYDVVPPANRCVENGGSMKAKLQSCAGSSSYLSKGTHLGVFLAP